VLPTKIANWSLISLQQRLVKTGGRLVKHARCYWLTRISLQKSGARCIFEWKKAVFSGETALSNRSPTRKGTAFFYDRV